MFGVYGYGTVAKGLIDALAPAEFLVYCRSPTKLAQSPHVFKHQLRECQCSLCQSPARCTLATAPMQIVEDPRVHTVFDAMGGAGNELSFEVCRAALERGKTFITANKLMVSERFRDIVALLDAHPQARFGMEACVCGGLPVLRTIGDFFLGTQNRVKRIYGIMNGSTNYLLDQAQRSPGADVGQIVAQMNNLGMLEADPSMDLRGFDAAFKLNILTNLVFGVAVRASMTVRGVTDVVGSDFKYMRLNKWAAMRLVAYAEQTAYGVQAFVLPAYVASAASPLANAHGCNNVVVVDSDAFGEGNPLVLMGPGAGKAPTANSMVADLGKPSLKAAAASADTRVCSPRGTFVTRYTVAEVSDTLKAASTVVDDQYCYVRTFTFAPDHPCYLLLPS